MRDRAPTGVLALLTTWLALASLGAQTRVAEQGAGRDAARMPRPQFQAAHIAALREGQLVDLNAAQGADLELLPGIGPRLAERILAERQRRGRFARIDDVAAVSGIGPAKLAKLRAVACAGATCAPSAAAAAQSSKTTTAESMTVQ